MLKWTARWGWCLLGLWLLAPAAAAATGGDAFAQGVGAFKAGDFTSALHYFRLAQTIGLDQPGLYYNLGVSLYKLGRYAEAEDAFRSCARDRGWAPLAYYNMGLSAYQRGERPVAADYFERALRTADSDNVRMLARTMLERTDPTRSHRARASLVFNLGYNDNVSLTADNQTIQTTSRSDRFSEFDVSVDGFWGQNSRAPRWSALLCDLRYAQLSDNNITTATLEVSKPITTEPWYSAASVQWEYALLDGHRFQQIASLRIEAVHARSDNGDLRLGAQVSAIDALDDNFSFLNGSRQQIDASFGQRFAGGNTRISASIERNQRDDLTTASEFFSFSPLRYGLWLGGSWSFGYWRIEPSFRYTHSRYADPDRRSGGVDATREDDEGQLNLRTSYRLTTYWRLHGEYSYLRNDSNFPEFEYTQRVAWIGATRAF